MSKEKEKKEVISKWLATTTFAKTLFTPGTYNIITQYNTAV